MWLRLRICFEFRLVRDVGDLRLDCTLRLVDRWSTHVADGAVLLIRRLCLLGRYHCAYRLAWGLLFRMGSLSVLVLPGVTLARVAWVCACLVTAHCDLRSYLHYRPNCLREMLLDLLALDLR